MVCTYVIILCFFIVNKYQKIEISLNYADIYVILMTFVINTFIFYYYAIIDYFIYKIKTRYSEHDINTKLSLFDRLKMATIQMLTYNSYAYIFIPQNYGNCFINEQNEKYTYIDGRNSLNPIQNETAVLYTREFYISGKINSQFKVPFFYGMIEKKPIFGKIDDIDELLNNNDNTRSLTNTSRENEYIITGINDVGSHNIICKGIEKCNGFIIFFLMILMSIMVCILFANGYPKCSNPIIKYKLCFDIFVLFCEINNISSNNFCCR